MMEAKTGSRYIRLGESFPVKSFQLSPGWIETDPEPSNLPWIAQEFAASTDSRVRLCFFYRGFPCAEESGDEFRTLLEKEADYVCSAQDLKAVQEILREAMLPGAFRFSSVNIVKLGNKRVLLVCGAWSDSGQKMRWLFCPYQNDYSNVAEIFFESAEPGFSKHLSEAIDMVNSIEWK